MPADKNLALVSRMVRDIWNLRDTEAADLIFSGDYINHGGLILNVVNGPESVKMSVELLRAAFPDFWVTLDEHHTDGERIIVRWTAFIEKPAIGLVEATGKKLTSLSGYFMCLIRGGRITESWTFWDRYSVIRSLGLHRALNVARIHLKG